MYRLWSDHSSSSRSPQSTHFSEVIPVQSKSHSCLQSCQRKQSDYKAVIKAVLKFLPRTPSALPFLPADAIPEAFFKLKRKANTDQLKAVADYIEQNWIVSNTWAPSCWSVYLRAVQTNNDVEGWHNRLNRRTYRQLQAKIFSLWDQYQNGDWTAKQLLRACSELYGL